MSVCDVVISLYRGGEWGIAQLVGFLALVVLACAVVVSSPRQHKLTSYWENDNLRVFRVPNNSEPRGCASCGFEIRVQTLNPKPLSPKH